MPWSAWVCGLRDFCFGSVRCEDMMADGVILLLRFVYIWKASSLPYCFRKPYFVIKASQAFGDPLLIWLDNMY